MAFNENLRILTTADTNHADNFNDIYGQLLENTKDNQGKISILQGNIDAHLAENTTEIISVTRDVSLTGIQTVAKASAREIKSIFVLGVVQGTKKWCQGMYSKGFNPQVTYTAGDTGNYLIGTALCIFSNAGSADRTIGSITNITTTSFDINWTKTGVGATGTAELRFLVSYHD
ncbi:hypothetical protein [Cellulosilyticum sp. I15G10I2]|uniref:hypothetical protein n=1 Tax=Cellulosilyticum sp. I15G10I2 TaxID=1892843 RepID=UPI00085C20EE|nr:hypothetical protein [Cellulosilyticum sp. I15G10I2]